MTFLCGSFYGNKAIIDKETVIVLRHLIFVDLSLINELNSQRDSLGFAFCPSSTFTFKSTLGPRIKSRYSEINRQWFGNNSGRVRQMMKWIFKWSLLFITSQLNIQETTVN